MKTKKWFLNIVLSVISFLLLLCLLGGSVILIKGYTVYKKALAETSLEQMTANIRNNPGYIQIKDLPDIYLDAVVATEDHRFFRHNGIDLIAIGRALLNNLKAKAFVEGGSSITQQLAKNQYFTQQKQLHRKVAEVFMTRQIEKRFSKLDILELYLNSIYFGDGYYGIGQASMGYLGIPASELDDQQATLLAGIPQSPSNYTLSKNPELAQQRQQKVVAQMVRHEFLTKTQAAEILAQPITGIKPTSGLRTMPGVCPALAG